MTGNARPKYEPPRAVDLSETGAEGQHTDGICAPGTSLVFESCSAGRTVGQGVCTSGNAYAACSPNGMLPEFGQCSPTGGAVVQVCSTGGVPA